MIKRHQLFRNEPHNEIFGDCQRTAIACLLDLEPHEVPHFVQLQATQPGYKWAAGMEEFLNGHGYTSVDVYYSSEASLSDVLAGRATYPDHYYLIAGLSPRNVDHVVIGRGAEIVWDPHPSGAGLIGPCAGGFWEMTFLMPLSMKQRAAA